MGLALCQPSESEDAMKYKKFPKMETLYRKERAALAIYEHMRGWFPVVQCDAARDKWKEIVMEIETRLSGK